MTFHLVSVWFGFEVSTMLVDLVWWSVETKYLGSRTEEEGLVASTCKESPHPTKPWLQRMEVGPHEVRHYTQAFAFTVQGHLH